MQTREQLVAALKNRQVLSRQAFRLSLVSLVTSFTVLGLVLWVLLT